MFQNQWNDVAALKGSYCLRKLPYIYIYVYRAMREKGFVGTTFEIFSHAQMITKSIFCKYPKNQHQYFEDPAGSAVSWSCQSSLVGKKGRWIDPWVTVANFLVQHRPGVPIVSPRGRETHWQQYVKHNMLRMWFVVFAVFLSNGLPLSGLLRGRRVGGVRRKCKD